MSNISIHDSKIFKGLNLKMCRFPNLDHRK